MLGSNGSVRASAGNPYDEFAVTGSHGYSFGHRTLIVDRLGHRYAVYATDTTPAGFNAVRSTDEGVTWLNLAPPQIGVALHDLQCVYLATRNALLVGALGPSGGSWYVWLYDIPTATWTYAGLPYDTGCYLAYSFSMDVDGNQADRVEIAFAALINLADTSDTLVYKLFDSSLGFTAGGTISDSLAAVAGNGLLLVTPLMLVASSSTAYAIWRYTSTNDVYYAIGTDGSNAYTYTWAATVFLGHFAGPLTGVIDAFRQPNVLFGTGSFTFYDLAATVPGWVTPVAALAAAPTAASLSLDPATNELTLLYTKASTGELALKTRDAPTATWSAETILQPSFSGYPSAARARLDRRTPYVYTSGATAPTTVESGGARLNQAPYPPVLEERTDFAANADAYLYWVFSDPNNDPQSAYQVVVERVSDLAVIYDSGKVVSSLNSATVPALTLADGVAYRWQVRVWDDSDAVSPYSSWALFGTYALPTAAITTPATNGITVTTGRLTPVWTFTSAAGLAQSAYQLQLYTVAGNVLVYDSGKVTSATARSVAITTALTTATNYRIDLTVWDSAGLAATVVSRTFTATFVSPMTPVIGSVSFTGTSPIAVVAYTNPTPSGGAPTVAYNELWRALNISGPWTRVETALLSSAAAHDGGLPLDNSIYYHKIRAVGTNLATTDSAAASGQYLGTALYLHSVVAPTTTGVALTLNTGPNEDSRALGGALMQYQGRSNPVMEFSDFETRTLRYPLTILDSTSERAALIALIERRETVCLRTPRPGQGEVLFGTVRAIGLSADFAFRTGTLEFTVTDYTEGV